MNKALGTLNNCEDKDECDATGYMEMDKEIKNNIESENSNSLSDHQDYPCPFCDVNIKGMGNVIFLILRVVMMPIKKHETF